MKLFFIGFIFCFFLFHTIPVDADNYYEDNSDNSYNIEDATDYPAIAKIEQRNFGKNYSGENIYLRLNRLEKEILGTNFPNDSLDSRLGRILKAETANNIPSESWRSIRLSCTKTCQR